MMKITAIALLYNLLLQSNAVGEPMVKVQICRDIFGNAIKDAVNRFDTSALKKEFGSWKVTERISNRNGRITYRTEEVPITKIQFEDLGKTQILSYNSSETRLKVTTHYGDKKFTQTGWRRTQNTYVFLNLEIIATLLFKLNKEEFVFEVYQCDAYLKSYETNVDENLNLQPGKVKGTGVSRLCLAVNQIIDTVNEKLNDYLNNASSSDESLVLKSSSYNPPDCVQLNLTLVVGNSEVMSAQKHEEMNGTGLSLAEGYFNALLSAAIKLTELKKMLEKQTLNLTPDELILLIHDVHETDPTILKVTITAIPQLSINAINKTVTVMMKLEGFSSKSDKPIFEVMFEIKVNVNLQLNNNQLILQFLSCGGQFINKWTSSIGKSGDLDYDNLEIFIKKLSNETILPLLDDLHVTFTLPFWNLGSKVVFKTGTVEILP